MGAPTRDAFGEALLELGAEDERIVVVDGDTIDSTRTKAFIDKFPSRGWNVGIAESNMVGIGAGLAASGKIPFICSFAAFLMANAYDQIRMGVAFPGTNAKLIGSHGGISPGEDGPSQMAVEDLALAGALGGVVVVVPSDANLARVLTKKIAAYEGPVYMRTGRPNAPVIYEEPPDAELGKGITVAEGDDLCIIANGLMVAEALTAAESLAEKGHSAEVIDMHTLKPLDQDAVRSATQKRGIIVAEEHFGHGGLGSAVAMMVAEISPTPIRFVNVGDRYSTSGQPEELFEDSGITSARILEKSLELLS
jgi:transketolase